MREDESPSKESSSDDDAHNWRRHGGRRGRRFLHNWDHHEQPWQTEHDRKLWPPLEDGGRSRRPRSKQREIIPLRPPPKRRRCLYYMRRLCCCCSAFVTVLLLSFTVVCIVEDVTRSHVAEIVARGRQASAQQPANNEEQRRRLDIMMGLDDPWTVGDRRVGTTSGLDGAGRALKKLSDDTDVLDGQSQTRKEYVLDGQPRAHITPDERTTVGREESSAPQRTTIPLSTSIDCNWKVPIGSSLVRNALHTVFNWGDGFPQRRGPASEQDPFGAVLVSRRPVHARSNAATYAPPDPRLPPRLNYFNAAMGTRGENQPYVVLALQYAIAHPEEDVILVVKPEYRSLVLSYGKVFKDAARGTERGAPAGAPAPPEEKPGGDHDSTWSSPAAPFAPALNFLESFAKTGQLTRSQKRNLLEANLANFRCMVTNVEGMTEAEQQHLDVEVLRSIGERRTTAWPVFELDVFPALRTWLEMHAYLHKFVYPNYTSGNIRLMGFQLMW